MFTVLRVAVVLALWPFARVADDVAEVDRAFDRFMTVSCARL